MPKDEDDIRQNIELSFRNADHTKARSSAKYAAIASRSAFCRDAQQGHTAHLWSIAKGGRHRLVCRPMCRRLATRLIPLSYWDTSSSLISGLPLILTQQKNRGVGSSSTWTVQSFDGRKYPWFRDDSSIPGNLQKAYKEPPGQAVGEVPVSGSRSIAAPKSVRIFPDLTKRVQIDEGRRDRPAYRPLVKARWPRDRLSANRLCRSCSALRLRKTQRTTADRLSGHKPPDQVRKNSILPLDFFHSPPSSRPKDPTIRLDPRVRCSPLLEIAPLARLH